MASRPHCGLESSSPRQHHHCPHLKPSTGVSGTEPRTGPPPAPTHQIWLLTRLPSPLGLPDLPVSMARAAVMGLLEQSVPCLGPQEGRSVPCVLSPRPRAATLGGNGPGSEVFVEAHEDICEVGMI